MKVHSVVVDTGMHFCMGKTLNTAPVPGGVEYSYAIARRQTELAYWVHWNWSAGAGNIYVEDCPVDKESSTKS